ncbi:unnamed protein product [Kuraishia capsulata CBS 1993]|uniref:Glycosyltransferase family 71 protein n=1 Tax=Kuraishia capsulata CBS 1993 TaxID=1382522 RepID=W6MIF1_9ASCO|nr:uncharacterized protein KUCA_T00000087001 [Kuraishia capsulata CBS 1993]CDK24127.1 unnamed protein product [Kuraishia capsulata CBS 1993]
MTRFKPSPISRSKLLNHFPRLSRNLLLAIGVLCIVAYVWHDGQGTVPANVAAVVYSKQSSASEPTVGGDIQAKVGQINDLLIDQDLSVIEKELANGDLEKVKEKVGKLKENRQDAKSLNARGGSRTQEDLMIKLDALLDAKLAALKESLSPTEIKIRSDSDTILKAQIKPRLQTLVADLAVTESMPTIQKFYINLVKVMLESEPLTKLHKRKYGLSNDKVFTVPMDRDYTGPMLTEAFLDDCLKFPKDFIEEMKNSHSKFVNDMPKSYPDEMYSGSGIVINGGREFSWLALLSIKMMRDNGGTLPVEVVMPYPEDYEPELCEEILPGLNAKCIQLADLFGEKLLKKLDFKKYQYKALVLLATSFENVLLLDSDNIPLSPLTEDMFEKEPFKSNGLVLWPDYWRRFTSPKFYDIAGIKVDDYPDRAGIDQYENLREYLPRSYSAKEELPLHDRKGAIPDPSTESGQLMISKKQHFKTLMLSFYYNFYGPDQFYPLLTQSRPGEGDKETFASAATVFNLPFYTVHQRVMANGYWGDDGFHGSGMMQFDPITDYASVQTYLAKMKAGELGTWTDSRLYNFINSKPKTPLFMHANFPKLEPFSMIKNGDLKNKMGERVKMFTAYDFMPPAFERHIWETMDLYFCQEQLPFKYIKTNFPESVDKRKEECAEIQEHLKFLTEFESDWLLENAQKKLNGESINRLLADAKEEEPVQKAKAQGAQADAEPEA